MDKLDVENDIRVIIKSKKDGVFFDQECCTCINIILNNDGEVATSFLGVHNEYLIKQLEKVQKSYFKALKKTLKQERLNTAKELKDIEESYTDDNDSIKDDSEKIDVEQKNLKGSDEIQTKKDSHESILNSDNKKSNLNKTKAQTNSNSIKNTKSKKTQSKDNALTNKVIEAEGNDYIHHCDKSGNPISKEKINKN